MFCFPANKTLYLECKIFGDSIVYGNIICLSFFDSFSFYLYILLYCLSVCFSLLDCLFYLSFSISLFVRWSQKHGVVSYSPSCYNWLKISRFKFWEMLSNFIPKTPSLGFNQVEKQKFEINFQNFEINIRGSKKLFTRKKDEQMLIRKRHQQTCFS